MLKRAFWPWVLLSRGVRYRSVPFGRDVYLLETCAVGGSGLCVVMKIFIRFRCFKSSLKLVAKKVYAKYW